MVAAGYLDKLVDLAQLEDFWHGFGLDFPTHPAVMPTTGDFTHVPVTIYGASVKVFENVLALGDTLV